MKSQSDRCGAKGCLTQRGINIKITAFDLELHASEACRARRSKLNPPKGSMTPSGACRADHIMLPVTTAMLDNTK